MDPGALKEWLSSRLLCISIESVWMEPVLVWTGSHAKTLFHQASAPRTGHRAPKKYLTPVFRVLPPEPSFARVLGQYEWFRADLCRQMLMLDEELKNVLNFLIFSILFL